MRIASHGQTVEDQGLGFTDFGQVALHMSTLCDALQGGKTGSTLSSRNREIDSLTLEMGGQQRNWSQRAI